jgi:phosphonate transport system ATP-binding protein
MLTIDGITRRFGAKTAVSDVSLEVGRGAFVGIIGRSGAGKSTLLRMINRLLEPSSGRISLRGPGRHRAVAARRCATGARPAP